MLGGEIGGKIILAKRGGLQRMYYIMRNGNILNSVPVGYSARQLYKDGCVSVSRNGGMVIVVGNNISHHQFLSLMNTMQDKKYEGISFDCWCNRCYYKRSEFLSFKSFNEISLRARGLQ